MPDLVFLCQHCGAKLIAFSKRAGQDIVCPKCRKTTHVPEHSDESLRPPPEGPAGSPHHGFNPVHHRMPAEHVVKQVAPPMRVYVIGGVAAAALFALVGYWSFNPGSMNPGKELPVMHHEPPRLPAEAPPPVEGHDWVSPITGMVFVWIPDFRMWVGRYEVTNDEYRRKEPAHDSRSYEDLSLNGPRHPVVYVSFDDARGYAEWLTGLERPLLGDLRYRLPAEDEWLALARCGEDRAYPWGNQWPPTEGRAGNYHGEEGAGAWAKLKGYRDGHPVTCPVEASGENPWRLCGIGGNVWEACLAADRTTFGGWYGGSWNNAIPERLHTTNRIATVGEPTLNQGFRLVLAR